MKPILDEAGRRRRFYAQPGVNEDRPFTPRDTDYEVAYKLHLYGSPGLPTWAIFPLTHYTNYKSFERYMTNARHSRFYSVGKWQFETSPFPEDKALLHRNPFIRGVSEEVKEKLIADGRWHRTVPSRSSSEKHDAYRTLMYYSAVHGLPPGWRIEMQHEVLDRLGLRPKLNVNGLEGEPDFLCILHTPLRSILIFNETCRAHNGNRTKNATRESWSNKFPFYKTLNSIAGNGRRNYQNLFKFDGGMLLTITTYSQRNLENILDVVEQEFGGPCNFIMGQAHSHFSETLIVPNDIYDFYRTPWYRTGREPYVFLDANTEPLRNT